MSQVSQRKKGNAMKILLKGSALSINKLNSKIVKMNEI